MLHVGNLIRKMALHVNGRWGMTCFFLTIGNGAGDEGCCQGREKVVSRRVHARDGQYGSIERRSNASAVRVPMTPWHV